MFFSIRTSSCVAEILCVIAKCVRVAVKHAQHYGSMLSESGKAEIPSSVLIISAISSFCRRFHALPESPLDAAPPTATAAIPQCPPTRTRGTHMSCTI